MGTKGGRGHSGRTRVAVGWAALVVAGPAVAAQTQCDAARLAGLGTELVGVSPTDAVARAAGGFEEACRGMGYVLQAAGDISAVSPERRRTLDIALAAKDDRWREACRDPKALKDALRMSRPDGRAHVWQECALSELGLFSREEWVGGLDGMLVLPLSASIALKEAGVDAGAARIVVRGMAGLPAEPPPAPGRGDALPTVDDLIAADADPDPVPPPLPQPVPLPLPLPAPAPLPQPVPLPLPVPAPAPAPAPVPQPVPVPVVAAPAPVAPPPEPVPEPAKPVPEPVPEPMAEPVGAAPVAGAGSAPQRVPPVVKPKFKDAGQADAKWSEAALASGGVCIVRIRVGPNGKMQKITFLECPDVLKPDVENAAAKSKYVPANDGEFPVAGAFRATWTVGE